MVHLADQRSDPAVRVGDRGGRFPSHASVLDAGDPCAVGAQPAEPGFAAAGYLGLLGIPAGRDRSISSPIE